MPWPDPPKTLSLYSAPNIIPINDCLSACGRWSKRKGKRAPTDSITVDKQRTKRCMSPTYAILAGDAGNTDTAARSRLGPKGMGLEGRTQHPHTPKQKNNILVWQPLVWRYENCSERVQENCSSSRQVVIEKNLVVGESSFFHPKPPKEESVHCAQVGGRILFFAIQDQMALNFAGTNVRFKSAPRE